MSVGLDIFFCAYCEGTVGLPRQAIFTGWLVVAGLVAENRDEKCLFGEAYVEQWIGVGRWWWIRWLRDFTRLLLLKRKPFKHVWLFIELACKSPTKREIEGMRGSICPAVGQFRLTKEKYKVISKVSSNPYLETRYLYTTRQIFRTLL